MHYSLRYFFTYSCATGLGTKHENLKGRLLLMKHGDRIGSCEREVPVAKWNHKCADWSFSVERLDLNPSCTVSSFHLCCSSVACICRLGGAQASGVKKADARNAGMTCNRVSTTVVPNAAGVARRRRRHAAHRTQNAAGCAGTRWPKRDFVATPMNSGRRCHVGGGRSRPVRSSFRARAWRARG